MREDIPPAATVLEVPRCPASLPDDIRAHMRALVTAWWSHDGWPRPSPEVLGAWDHLLEEWIESREMPLYIRKDLPRGQRLTHSSGRPLVPVDNSVAQWAFGLALQGICPSPAEIRALQERDEIPVAMILKRSERSEASYRCTLGGHSLNKRGWKLCHIDPVRLGGKGDIALRAGAELEAHFRRLLSPSNMFLVPCRWAGLGEIPEIIEAASKHVAEGVLSTVATGGAGGHAHSQVS
jgi:hypothetical protein